MGWHFQSLSEAVHAALSPPAHLSLPEKPRPSLNRVCSASKQNTKLRTTPIQNISSHPSSSLHSLLEWRTRPSRFQDSDRIWRVGKILLGWKPRLTETVLNNLEKSEALGRFRSEVDLLNDRLVHFVRRGVLRQGHRHDTPVWDQHFQVNFYAIALQKKKKKKE